MAEQRERSGSGWLGFIAAILLVGVIGLGFYAYINQQRDVAQLEIDMPDVDIDAPDIDLPEPPPLPAPPQAESSGDPQPLP